MRVVWCKELEDVVNIARSQGWLFYHNFTGKHYYYVYAGAEAELICLVVEVKEPMKAKYVSIDDEGKLKTSDRPIMPACARVMSVVKDKGFEELLK